VEINHAAKIEQAGKERFLRQKKIVKTNLGCCSLNKKQSVKLKHRRLESIQALEYLKK
jgi:hypothetical protein